MRAVEQRILIRRGRGHGGSRPVQERNEDVQQRRHCLWGMPGTSDSGASYYIEVISPFFYSLTVKDAGGDDALDNDFDAETGSTDVFSFGAGSSKVDWDVGLYKMINE